MTDQVKTVEFNSLSGNGNGGGPSSGLTLGSASRSELQLLADSNTLTTGRFYKLTNGAIIALVLSPNSFAEIALDSIYAGNVVAPTNQNFLFTPSTSAFAAAI